MALVSAQIAFVYLKYIPIAYSPTSLQMNSVAH